MIKSMLSGLLLVLAGVASAPGAEDKDAAAAELAREVHDKGWIVYGGISPKGDWDLFLCRPDGSGVTNITNTPSANEVGPRFSPDGSRLLYRRLAPGEPIKHDVWGFSGELVISNADGSDPKAFGAEDEYPWGCWSPDGRQISCLTRKGIQIVDIASRKVVRELPRQGMYQQLFWSPDGKYFCGVTNKLGEMWTVARMNAETGDINAVNTFQNCTPDWFPDSRRVIFSNRPDGQGGYGWTHLYAANGDGGERQLVYGEDGMHIYGGALSPDGKYVLLTALPVDGGNSEKSGAPMFVIRLSDTPMIRGKSELLRKHHPDTKDGPVVPLPTGFEPHWTFARVKPAT